MRDSTKKAIYKIDVGIEEFILIFLIILNIFDFLELLPGELDYIKKIISWTLLGYLLYKANLTKIFFGTRNKSMDFIIIITYFFLVFKNFIAYTIATYAEVLEKGVESFLYPLFNFFAANQGAMANAFEHYTFYIGGTLLILVSIFLALKVEIRAPSIMHVLHEEGVPPRRISKLLLRFATIFFVLTAFFVIIFNLVMEWLAIAVDAPIIVLALFFYIFILVKHVRRMKPDSLLFRIGNAGEGFYERFIKLFYSQATIMLGVIGMLVLHLLTDLANFIVPYITTLRDPLYFSALNPATHQHLITLFLQDKLAYNIFTTSFVYLFNIIGIVLLLISPAVIWYVLYRKREFDINNILIGLFYVSISAFLLVPLFKITKLTVPNLIGVDILTQAIASNPGTAVLVSIAIGVLAFLLSYVGKIKKTLIFVAVAAVQLFFALYVYHFFVSFSNYYIHSIGMLFKNLEIFIGAYMFIFFGITILFYVLGLLAFIHITWKN